MNYLSKIAVTFMAAGMMACNAPKSPQAKATESRRDSLTHLFQKKTLALLETPYDVKPMAFAQASVEYWKIDTNDIYVTHFPDETLSTPNDENLLDVDEMLHASKGHAYVSFDNEDGKPYLIARVALEDLNNYYKADQAAKGFHDAKLYLECEDDPNAVNLSTASKRRLGLRTNIPICAVSTGILSLADTGMVKTAARHETEHGPHEKALLEALTIYISPERSDKDLIADRHILGYFHEYLEYQADSGGYADWAVKQKTLPDQPVGNPNFGFLIVICQRGKESYQHQMENALLNMTEATEPRKKASAAKDSALISDMRKEYEQSMSFTSDSLAHHFNPIERIYHLLILNAYFIEAQQHGKQSQLAQDLNALLPKRPDLKASRYDNK